MNNDHTKTNHKLSCVNDKFYNNNNNNNNILSQNNRLILILKSNKLKLLNL